MRRLFILFIGLIFWQSVPGYASAASMAWTNDQAMLIFFEAMTQIKKQSLDRLDAGQITTDALKAYMHRHDPYGDYLSPEEYRQWKQAQKITYYGVGMEIVQRNGHFFCLPRKTSPAEAAGIQQGDELLAVDGTLVSGRSIYWVGSRIRGQQNSRVRLRVNSRNLVRELDLKRSPTQDISVWLSTEAGLNILRISHFSPRSFEEIKAVLQRLDEKTPLVLDLRNNPGGDLFAAVDIAGLFLPKGSKILTIETNRDTTDYTAKGHIWNGRKLAVWQNSFTASASEILITGLMDNDMAVNFGSNSYGKAMTQTVLELSDHSALIISRGRLAGPKGSSWQDLGILPMVHIKDSDNSWGEITRQNLK
jgi:carboxyl-terminal processing protease